MAYRRLFIFVEGNDDEKFFQRILLPRLQEKNDGIRVIKYSQKPKKIEYLEKFIRAIKSMGDYIYVTDINNSPCVTAKKQETQNKLRNIDEDRIIVVIKEIESWYLAGLCNADAEKFKICNFSNTDSITKEQFNSLIPKTFDSRIDFMIEILKIFSIKIAKLKNKSFRYFVEKYNCEISENVSNSV